MGNGVKLAAMAMVARQVRQELLAHNLANVSTPGYKASRVFNQVLDEVDGNVHDVARGAEAYTDFSQGGLLRTGRNMDFALDGEGFFVVQTPEGERYTRSGNFSIDGDGLLVDPSGLPVLSETGPIRVEGKILEAKQDGELLVDGVSLGKLRIKNFASTADLVLRGSGLFGPRPGTTLAEAEPAARVYQGYLEESNVVPIEEMVRMMSHLRSYESSHRMMQMQGGALGRVVNELIRD